eukprot:2005764-Pleurochrysis_carterae.AAC.3
MHTGRVHKAACLAAHVKCCWLEQAFSSTPRSGLGWGRRVICVPNATSSVFAVLVCFKAFPAHSRRPRLCAIQCPL